MELTVHETRTSPPWQKAILEQPLEHSSDVLNMFLERRRKYQYVIQVDIYELIYHVSQHVIDECLENRGGVGQPEGHNKIFKVPPGGIKRGLPLIPLPNADQMISVTQIEFTKDGCSLQPLESWRHQRQRISILYRDVVQPSIINARSQRTILLSHEKKPCPSGRRGRTNEPGC